MGCGCGAQPVIHGLIPLLVSEEEEAYGSVNKAFLVHNNYIQKYIGYMWYMA